jgi:hypothetical protein
MESWGEISETIDFCFRGELRTHVSAADLPQEVHAESETDTNLPGRHGRTGLEGLEPWRTERCGLSATTLELECPCQWHWECRPHRGGNSGILERDGVMLNPR